MADYNPMELMICVAARNLEDGATVVVGTGAPCAAAMLAQKTHSPNLCIMFEAGGIAPILPSMPISVGDSRTFHRAILASSMPDVMETCQRGMVDYTFLGGAQIDMYGNINSTMIGDDHAKPKVRFPGSGGANDLASLCWRTMMMTPQDAKRFTDKINFITSPGYLQGGNTRYEAGLPKGTGPYRIITNMAIMGFDEETKWMKVLNVNPGYSRKDIQDNCGFELKWADKLVDTDPPHADELRILREEVDPHRYIIGR
ncbi:MAG TPA: CoA-transferase [Spirochaetota bacterium]|nr:CoA-transferase [Spirochaetota bacterium]HPL18055.1 CoA-transferase [Spirochaetota bacterium]HPV40989.1 CoA-transferase [Spirochaetota bacterium]HQF08251.1 CoA-transferase [Spirochaetota bacterium]HQH97134.1 CoA-transferase [Spirochaetota bacterium]